MKWPVDKSQQGHIKFIFECFQAVAVVLGIITALYTYSNDTADRKAKAEESAKAVARELSRPYREKKLAVYVEAARVVARLAATPVGVAGMTDSEAKFWELYWGELAFFESSEIKTLMEEFCTLAFSEARCSGQPTSSSNATLTNSAQTRAAMNLKAIAIAQRASQEIKKDWTDNRI